MTKTVSTKYVQGKALKVTKDFKAKELETLLQGVLNDSVAINTSPIYIEIMRKGKVMFAYVGDFIVVIGNETFVFTEIQMRELFEVKA
jgi:hypothetical protein